jgi:hypothetical protein
MYSFLVSVQSSSVVSCLNISAIFPRFVSSLLLAEDVAEQLMLEAGIGELQVSLVRIRHGMSGFRLRNSLFPPIRR